MAKTGEGSALRVGKSNCTYSGEAVPDPQTDTIAMQIPVCYRNDTGDVFFTLMQLFNDNTITAACFNSPGKLFIICKLRAVY